MKKICIDVNSVVPRFVSGRMTGIGRTTYELVNALDQLPDKFIGFSLCSQNMKGIGALNMDVNFLKKHFYFPHRPFFDECVARCGLKERFSGADLLHIPHNFDRVWRPSRTLLTIHDALFMRIEEKQFAHAQMRQSVPILARNCRGIITCSEASRRDIIELMGVAESKVDVAHWGIDHSLFFPRAEKEQAEVLVKYGIRNSFFFSVSCNSERKRTDKLVESFLIFAQQRDDVDLVLVWANPPLVLISKIEKTGLSKRVHFLKNIPDSDLATLYSAARALFFISSYEGFGLPLIEAMACGCEVATCKNSSLPEIGGDVPYYIEDPLNDPILELMYTLANSVVNSLKIEQGLIRAQQYTWQSCAEKYHTFYQKWL